MKRGISMIVGAVMAVGVLMAPVTPAWALPNTYTTVYAFGDSLSDSGNVFALSGGTIPPPAVYAPGQFSDGPNWIDQLTGSMPAAAITPILAGPPPAPPASLNFSFGGASSFGNLTPGPVPAPVPGLLTDPAGFGLLPLPGLSGVPTSQVDLFKSAVGSIPGVASSTTLFSIYSGANDYLLGVLDPSTGVPAPDPSVTVGNIVATIEELHDLGAREFVIPNLPDLGMVPLVAELDALGPPGLAGIMTGLTDAHNALLLGALMSLHHSLPEANFYMPDVHALAHELAAHDAEYSTPGPAAGCLPGTPFSDISHPLFTPCDPTGPARAFYDEQHPSAAVHGQIAETALATAAIPEPASLAVFVFGLAALVLFGRRRVTARA